MTAISVQISHDWKHAMLYQPGWMRKENAAAVCIYMFFHYYFDGGRLGGECVCLVAFFVVATQIKK
jgi:hypothetical protein